MNRQELKNKLNRCCDIMRDDGLVPLQYIEQLSWLLFLKLFDEQEKQQKILNPDYKFIFEEKYRWSNWANKFTGEELKEFIEKELIPYLSNLSGTLQKAKIASIFKGIKNHMRSGYNLAEVIEIIKNIDFSSPEDTQILSIAYEELLMFTAGQVGGGAGEFYTPRPIVRFMIKIIEPKIGERILDPFCGSAGFLVESYKYLREKAKTLKEHKILQEETFYGQELKSFSLIVGTLNAMLHGIDSPNITEANSFAEDLRSLPEEKKFDIILTNPPFGGEAAKRSLATFTIKTSDTELAGLYLCMRKLKVGGRCGIVQPEGVLFRTSGAYKQVKKELLENYNLHTIISLPPGVFANVSPKGGSGPKTNLLFFEKGIPTKEIWYYELIPPNGKNYTRTNPIKDEDLDDAFNKWQKLEISENSWIVKVEDIIKNDYDLSAKNPNKTKSIVYKPPEELIKSILEKEKEIEEILKEIKI
ncbi:MAG: type I restriction-modification system subunit M [Candidatus Omnitrophica bacterium]|nr:type I restriction-modification system subunit M [Candidatus Omnitrophota bacterium]